MNDELISRQAAIDIVFRSPFFSDSLTEELRALPSVQQKTGRWINISPLLTAARCSECKSAFAERTNYCPHCGARMEETENE